jgi:hypothetical protein
MNTPGKCTSTAPSVVALITKLLNWLPFRKHAVVVSIDNLPPNGAARNLARGPINAGTNKLMSPTINSVPVICRDGGPQFDRADVPTAEGETVFGTEFETEDHQERVL